MSIDYRQERRWKIKTLCILAQLCAEKVSERQSRKEEVDKNFIKSRESAKVVAKQLSDMVYKHWHEGIAILTDDCITTSSNIKEEEQKKKEWTVTDFEQTLNNMFDQFLSSDKSSVDIPNIINDQLTSAGQKALLSTVDRYCSSGLGVHLYGDRFHLVTGFTSCVVHHWSYIRKRKIYLLSSLHTIIRYISEIKSNHSALSFGVYSSYDPIGLLQSECDVMFIPIDQINSFLASKLHYSSAVAGVVIDTRGRVSGEDPYQCMASLNAHVPAASWRCLVSDSDTIPSSYSLLSFLIPCFTTSEWKSKLPVSNDDMSSGISDTKMSSGISDAKLSSGISDAKMSSGISDAKLQRVWDINRITIDQVLFAMKRKVKSFIVRDNNNNNNDNNNDSRVNEEVLFVDLEASQVVKYRMVSKSLVFSCEVFSGRDKRKISEYLTLLSRIIFDSSLVSISLADPSSPDLCDDSSDETTADRKRMGPNYDYKSFQSFQKNQTVDMFQNYINSSMINYRILSSDASSPKLSTSDATTSSCKLKSLLTILESNQTGRAVVIVNSAEELRCTHRFLIDRNCRHWCADIIDRPHSNGDVHYNYWDRILLSKAVHDFNCTSPSERGVLLATNRIFTCSLIPPRSIDRLIILNDNWVVQNRTNYYDVIRSNSRSNKELKVIRLVARNTIEEVINHHQQGISGLQGMKVQDLKLLNLLDIHDDLVRSRVHLMSFLIDAPYLLGGGPSSYRYPYRNGDNYNIGYNSTDQENWDSDSDSNGSALPADEVSAPVPQCRGLGKGLILSDQSGVTTFVRSIDAIYKNRENSEKQFVEFKFSKLHSNSFKYSTVESSSSLDDNWLNALEAIMQAKDISKKTVATSEDSKYFSYFCNRITHSLANYIAAIPNGLSPSDRLLPHQMIVRHYLRHQDDNNYSSIDMEQKMNPEDIADLHRSGYGFSSNEALLYQLNHCIPTTEDAVTDTANGNMHYKYKIFNSFRSIQSNMNQNGNSY